MTHIAHEPNKVEQRFREVYEALASERSTWDESIWLRFAAFAVMLHQGSPKAVARAIRERGDSLRRHSPWFSALSSPVRFMVAAVLLQSNVTTKMFNDLLAQTKASFDHIGLRHHESYDVISAVIIQLMNHGKPLGALHLERIKNLYDHMKNLHWWLTGPRDVPSAVLLSFRKDKTDNIVTDAERIYQQLTAYDYIPGDALHTSAHMLVWVDKDAQSVQRFDALAHACVTINLPLNPSDYESLALLTLLHHPAEEIAHRCRYYHESLRELKIVMHSTSAFALACDLTFLDLVRWDRHHRALTDLKEVADMLQSLQLLQVLALMVAWDDAHHLGFDGSPQELWPMIGTV